MKLGLVQLIAFGVVVVAHPSAADEPKHLPASVPEVSPAPCAESCASECARTIRTRNIQLIEKQSACTLPELPLREVEVGRDRRTELEIVYNESRQWCTELVLKPRTIEQEVCCTEVKPITTIDPCTGCPCTVHQPVQVTKRVQITVYDVVPEQKEYIVRTPSIKPVEREVIVKKLTVDAITIPAIETRLEAIPTDCEIKVPLTPRSPAPFPCK